MERTGVAHFNTKRLTGKTGSERGTGRCEALLLAEQGAKAVVSDIGTNEQGASTAGRVADEIRAAGGEAIAYTENIATLEGARNIGVRKPLSVLCPSP